MVARVRTPAASAYHPSLTKGQLKAWDITDAGGSECLPRTGDFTVNVTGVVPGLQEPHSMGKRMTGEERKLLWVTAR